jgi:hypothetical protein
MTRVAWALLLSLAGGCGAASTPASSPATSGPRDASALEGATVYDATGAASSCRPPSESCPPAAAANREFLDRCKLGGYQVRRCGCEDVCTGNVMQAKPHYDANGTAKECQPPDLDCAPPETSAAFQDACTGVRRKLVVCGCEWLCTGPLKP